MKIVSWNVNGLRKLKPLEKLFSTFDADILCFQETRISGLWDESLESVAFVDGYDSFFSICKQRRGYSGVATFCRKGVATPCNAWEGLDAGVGGVDLKLRDRFCGSCEIDGCPCQGDGCPVHAYTSFLEEGRCVTTDHGNFVLINVYVPAVSIEERITFKMYFLHALQDKVSALHANGRQVVIAGDFNICPQKIDCAEPIPKTKLSEWQKRPSRQWLQRLLSPEGDCMVDSFREMHPRATMSYSCWSEATRARENNHGVRTDLIVMSRDLYRDYVTGANVLSHMNGSDHCPVSVTLRRPASESQVPKVPPKLCTVNLPRFSHRQQSLKDMLARKSSTARHTGQARRPGLGLSSPPKNRCLLEDSRRAASSLRQPKTISKKKTPKRQATLLEFVRKKPDARTDGEDRRNTSRGAAIGISSPGRRTSKELSTQHRKGDEKRRNETAKAWRKILTGPPPPPLCKHGLPCVLKTVGKSGENRGRTFFSCAYPAGIGQRADCHFFMWASSKAGAIPR